MRCTQADRRAGDRRPNNPPRSRDLPPDELEAPRPDQGQNCVASPDDNGEDVVVDGGGNNCGGGNDGGLVVFMDCLQLSRALLLPMGLGC